MGSRPLAFADPSVEFKARQGQVVWAAAVLAHLNHSEEPESLIAELSVDVHVYAPGASSSFLLKVLLLLFKGLVLSWILSQVNPPVKDGPVSFVIRALEVPVHQHMSGWVPIPDTVASW